MVMGRRTATSFRTRSRGSFPPTAGPDPLLCPLARAVPLAELRGLPRNPSLDG